MASPFQRLLTPYPLNDKIILKNRITFPNSTHGLIQGPEGWPAEAMFQESAQICASGASLFSFPHFGKNGGGSAPIKGKTQIPVFDYSDPALRNYLSQMASQSHMLGSKIVVKLGIAWPKGYTYGGGDARSLFPLPEGTKITYPANRAKPLTREEMENRICPKELLPQLVEDLVDVAALYKQCGFDGISFRADRYIDADTNLRTDEYGGAIENRGRICLEVFEAIKKRLGRDFLIEVAMPGAQDHGMDGEMPHGYTLEEAIRFAKMTEHAVDIFQLRDSGMQRYHPTGFNSEMHVHESLKFCRAFKDAGIKTTISANAGFVDPEDMQNALDSGDCDLISAGRVFLAEPEFVRKLYDAPNERPVPCIQCDVCHGTRNGLDIAMCALNPRTGIRHRIPAIFDAPRRSKKVAVIGGGPIGMRAACFAAEAGHSVTLFEKNDYLGGKMKYADIYKFKWPLKRYREWLKDELVRRKVEVHLNCEPSPEWLAAQKFDAVIACTGSVAARPDVPGADRQDVWTAEDVYMERAVLGKKIVVVGGGSVATETALHLAQIGKDVTIVTRQNDLAMDSYNPHDGLHKHSEVILPELGYGGYIPLWRVYDNFTEVYQAKTVAVTPTSVTYEKDGVQTTLEADSVIVTGGYRDLRKEALAYAACAPEFYMAGDVEYDSGDLQKGNVSAFGKVSLL